jgi:hypothetical protein
VGIGDPYAAKKWLVCQITEKKLYINGNIRMVQNMLNENGLESFGGVEQLILYFNFLAEFICKSSNVDKKLPPGLKTTKKTSNSEVSEKLIAGYLRLVSGLIKSVPNIETEFIKKKFFQCMRAIFQLSKLRMTCKVMKYFLVIFNDLSTKNIQQILFNEFLLNKDFICRLDEETLGLWVEFIGAYYKYIRSFPFYSNYLGKRMLMLLIGGVKSADNCCGEHVFPGFDAGPGGNSHKGS